MVTVLVRVLLAGMTLAGLTRTTADAQETVTHTFFCPNGVNGKTQYDSRISSNPTFALELNPNLYASFKRSVVSGQDVVCEYQWGQTGGYGSPVVLRYSYTVHRQILKCDNVGAASFTCQLKR